MTGFVTVWATASANVRRVRSGIIEREAAVFDEKAVEEYLRRKTAVQPLH